MDRLRSIFLWTPFMPLQPRDEPYPHVEFRHPSSADRLRIVPERGGLISGWVCAGREILYLDAERFADAHASVRGGIPILFPICGNLPGDHLALPEGDVILRQHGFARDLPWALDELPDGGGVRLRLCDSPATHDLFPFAFALTLEVRPEPGALSIMAVVENTGEGMLPFSLGFHPYFALTALEAAVVEGLPDRCLDHDTMAPADTAPLLERLDAGVDLLAGPVRAVRLLDRGSGHGVELQLHAPFDLAVIWSDPPRPMVCLEPWTAPRGSLATGERRLDLAPGAMQRLGCRYAVIEASAAAVRAAP